jgi:hypothetical protein
MSTAAVSYGRPALPGAVPQAVEPALKRWLWLLLITLFLPSELSVTIAGLEWTALRFASTLLFFYVLSKNLYKPHWADLFVASIYVSVFLSVAISERGGPLRGIVVAGRMFLDTGVPYLVARAIGPRREVVVWFMQRLITLLAIFTVTVLIESATGKMVHRLFWAPLTGNWPTRETEVRLGFVHRAYGWTRHPIMLGLVYVMAVPAAIAMMRDARNYRFKWGWLKLLLMGVSIFCTVSFGSWMTLVVILVLISWDHYAGKWLKLSPRMRWGVVATVVIVSLIIMKLTTDNPLLMVLMYHLHAHQGAWLYRWQLFERIFREMDLGDCWVMGYGEDIPERFQAGRTGRSVDNNYLATLLLYGQVGVVAWVSAHLAPLFCNIKECWIKKDLPGTALASGFGVVIIGSLLSQIFVCIFSTALTLNFIVMGFAIGQAQCLAAERKLLSRKSPAQGNPSASQPQPQPRRRVF